MLPDLLPKSQLYMGNALIALMTGLGSLAGTYFLHLRCTNAHAIAGNFLGSRDLTEIFTFSASQVQALYTIAAIVMVSTVAAGVITTKERPQGEHSRDEETHLFTPPNGEQHTSDASLAGKDEIALEGKDEIRDSGIYQAAPTPKQGCFRRTFDPIVQIFTYLRHFPKKIRSIFAIQVSCVIQFLCYF